MMMSCNNVTQVYLLKDKFTPKKGTFGHYLLESGDLFYRPQNVSVSQNSSKQLLEMGSCFKNSQKNQNHKMASYSSLAQSR